MMKLRPLFVVMLLLLVGLDSSADQSARTRQGAVTVNVSRPLVLGFLPPFTKAEEQADDGGIREGIAHVRFALEDISKCHGDKSATYRLEVTRLVTLRDGKRVRSIKIARDREHAVGIILAMPGRPVRTVFATDGPSSLIQLGRAAAADYFGAQACRENK